MIDSLPRQLPDGLLRKLEEARPYLERTGGSIQERKRDGSYSLRIRVDDPDRGRIHKRITLGGDGDAYNVQMLIDAWRREYDAGQAEEERQREEERAYSEKVKALRTAILARASGPSQRRRLAREFSEAAADPVRLLAYLMAGAYALGPVPKRRRRGGLA
jgi:hypothetical protein